MMEWNDERKHFFINRSNFNDYFSNLGNDFKR